jgi:transcriptional regulator with XRE-family HTH domain
LTTDAIKHERMRVALRKKMETEKRAGVPANKGVADVAKAIGISVDTFSMFMKGITAPGPKVEFKIEQYLNGEY